MRLRALTAAGIALLGAAAGCSSSTPTNPPEKTSETQAGVFGDPHPERSEVGFPIVLQGISGSFTTSGVMLRPDLVATELRSVVKAFAYGVGTFASGGEVCATVGATVDLGQIRFVPGDGRSNTIVDPSVSFPTGIEIKQIITNGEIDSCKGGIAFLVLATPVTGSFNYPQLELDNPPAANDAVTGCGWGRINTKCDYPEQVICAGGNVMLPTGGYYAADQDTFPSSMMLTSIPTCYNDVGGPVYNQNNVLIGILDKYFQPDKSKKDTLSEACASCDGTVTGAHLFSAYKDLTVRAFAAVGSSPWRAGHPQPADVGAKCTDSLDCNSQYCVSVGKDSYCSQDCSTTACPASTVCTTVGAQSVCLPQVSPKPASCSIAAAPQEEPTGHTSAWAAFAGLALVLFRARRRGRDANGRDA